MSTPYWPETLPQAPMIGLEFGPQDVKAAFEADTGEPISRPRTTGAPLMAKANFTFEGAQIATFTAFYADTLAQGSQRFALRDPITDELRMWRFMGGYRRQFLLKTIARVEAELMMLPGVPWFSPYGREGLSTVPAFVADYENDVYGIDGNRVPASDLPTIEGTYDVVRTVSGATTETGETLTAGDIPETAPANTTLIVGFLPPASGGAISDITGYRVHTFTSGGTFTVQSGAEVEYLILSGGGSGAVNGDPRSGNGGGAGGVIRTGSKSLAAGSYSIVVGDGGLGVVENGANPGTPVDGNPGAASTAFGVTAPGGGGGGFADPEGNNTTPAGDGGSNADYAGGTGGGDAGGGGAGASQAGSDGAFKVGGDGGDGLASSISGTSTVYGGGGGASGRNAPGLGGAGGGTDGVLDAASSASAAANTGAGSGALSTTSATYPGAATGDGGSGIVIVRYKK